LVPEPAEKRVEVKLESIEISTPKAGDVEDEPTEREGRVKFFNDEKGYGFIIDKMTQESYFVHVEHLGEVQIQSNDKVTFEIGMGPKGPIAQKVKLVS
ncbi:MAG: cold shock domain-containing protein, partial [Saprospiraceae bacterium]|nr:cold shock domain-containing protein [Saprospiraceae bacterium]